jgi:hypothetical protein
MDCPDREVILEGECYIGINLHLLVVLLAGSISFKDVLYPVLTLKLCYRCYVRLGIWGDHRLRCRVPRAFAHFVKEHLIECEVGTFSIESCTAGIRFGPIVEASRCHLLVDLICLELCLWSVGDYGINLP